MRALPRPRPRACDLSRQKNDHQFARSRGQWVVDPLERRRHDDDTYACHEDDNDADTALGDVEAEDDKTTASFILPSSSEVARVVHVIRCSPSRRRRRCRCSSSSSSTCQPAVHTNNNKGCRHHTRFVSSPSPPSSSSTTTCRCRAHLSTQHTARHARKQR